MECNDGEMVMQLARGGKSIGRWFEVPKGCLHMCNSQARVHMHTRRYNAVDIH